MNFTREPIVETIISAKEGYKLSIKSSKTTNGEEYLVDAVEVVSYHGSFFYRCQERPKTFFIPANDFEIVEVKETRILIKNPNIDKNIKIAGGKEKQAKAEEQPKEAPKQEQKREKKKGRRGKTKVIEAKEQQPKPKEIKESTEEKDQDKPSVFSHLLTPPTGLISETLVKYKQETTPETLNIETEKEKAPKKTKTAPKKTKAKEPEQQKIEETPPQAQEDQSNNITSEPPKPGELLEEKEINAEPFAKATTEDKPK